MEHWTDKFKHQASEAATNAKRAEEAGLAADRAIRAAFDPFWQTVIECAYADGETLRRKYPGQPVFDCDVVVEGRSLKIRRKSYPFRNITITPNIDAHILSLIKALDLDTLGNPYQPERDVIRMSAIGSDLRLECHGKPLLTPNDVSEHLFTYVCATE